jgi:hypothetical protein
MDSFRIDENQFYGYVTGSGNETAAHLLENVCIIKLCFILLKSAKYFYVCTVKESARNQKIPSATN